MNLSKISIKAVLKSLALLLGLSAALGVIAGDDAGPATPGPAYSGFTNQGSILNTRHNLTQSTLANLAGGGAQMDGKRNNYFQVCVYCHTPHGANTAAAVPLWNRNLPTGTTYTTYTGLTQAVAQPGAASLSCLSCHDGQQAVDAIWNMPGSGKYTPNPTAADLTAWRPAGQPGRATAHLKLAPGTLSTGCLSCHQPDAAGGDTNAVDFTVAYIGTDLRNDHPIGVSLPSGTDWNVPSGTKVAGGLTNRYFDTSPSDGRLEKTEVRFYDTGAGAKVECASCHDPHGVPSGAAGSTFNPTFLRVTADGSQICFVCHVK